MSFFNTEVALVVDTHSHGKEGCEIRYIKRRAQPTNILRQGWNADRKEVTQHTPILICVQSVVERRPFHTDIYIYIYIFGVHPCPQTVNVISSPVLSQFTHFVLHNTITKCLLKKQSLQSTFGCWWSVSSPWQLVTLLNISHRVNPDGVERFSWSLRPVMFRNSQIPQCTSPISHNTLFRAEMCVFLFLNGALWDMVDVHCGICELGQFDHVKMVVRHFLWYRWEYPPLRNPNFISKISSWRSLGVSLFGDVPLA